MAPPKPYSRRLLRSVLAGLGRWSRLFYKRRSIWAAPGGFKTIQRGGACVKRCKHFAFCAFRADGRSSSPATQPLGRARLVMPIRQNRPGSGGVDFKPWFSLQTVSHFRFFSSLSACMVTACLPRPGGDGLWHGLRRASLQGARSSRARAREPRLHQNESRLPRLFLDRSESRLPRLFLDRRTELVKFRQLGDS